MDVSEFKNHLLEIEIFNIPKINSDLIDCLATEYCHNYIDFIIKSAPYYSIMEYNNDSEIGRPIYNNKLISVTYFEFNSYDDLVYFIKNTSNKWSLALYYIYNKGELYYFVGNILNRKINYKN